MMPIYGFTLLRNGVKYDYPFRESILSLAGICDRIYIALGDSSDATEQELRNLPCFPKLTLIPTTWDENKRKGGIILSEQTNIALQSLREACADGWGFYLQGDEVLNERDAARIRADLARAESEGADAVSFRYLHFWLRYDALGFTRRWYPQEIRAIRLRSGAESYGDAQSFRGWSKRLESDAAIYHYGHVREAQAYENKKRDFHRWWHPDSEMAKVLARGEKSDANEPVLRYLGPHPEVMRARMARQNYHEPATPAAPPLLLGDSAGFSPEFRAILPVGTQWTGSSAHALGTPPERTVLLQDISLWDRIRTFGRYRTRIPLQMGSPQALPWTREFRAILMLSEKGYSTWPAS